MVAYVKVHRDYLGIVIAQLKKVNGVRILKGLGDRAPIEDLCVKSNCSEDLRYRLEEIDKNNYLMFEYKIC